MMGGWLSPKLENNININYNPVIRNRKTILNRAKDSYETNKEVLRDSK